MIIRNDNVFWITSNVDDFSTFIHRTWWHQWKWQMCFDETPFTDIWNELIAWNANGSNCILIHYIPFVLIDKHLLGFIMHKNAKSVLNAAKQKWKWIKMLIILIKFLSCEIHHSISSLKKSAKMWIQVDWIRNHYIKKKNNSLKKWWSFGEKIALCCFIIQIVGNHPNQFLGPCCTRTRISGNPYIIFSCFEIVEMFGVFLKCTGEEIFLWANLNESIFFTWIIKSCNVSTNSIWVSVCTKIIFGTWYSLTES